MKRGSPLFWASYPGMAMIGFGGLGLGCAAATAMLLFRSSIEPWLTYVFPVVTGLLGRHVGSAMRYEPAYYPWIAGFIYLMSALCLGVMGFAAYRKPQLDRRVDAYLRRQMQFETPLVEPLQRSDRRDDSVRGDP